MEALAYRETNLYYERHQRFPDTRAWLLPTQLGNVLRASEEYAGRMYGLDTVTWWPRLTPLLPAAFRADLQDAVTPMVALLNLSLLVTIVTLADALLLLVMDDRWPLYVAILAGGLLLARLFYLAAVTQARGYGDLVRVAFDLYRHSILRQMCLPLPPDLKTERVMWPALTQWLVRHDPPWEVPLAQLGQLPTQLQEPLTYTAAVESAAEEGKPDGA